MKFSELKLNDRVLEALDAMRFDECTPVQEQTIPVILDGKDLIAVAQTGTGKTAAFLLPVLNKLSEGGHPEDAINCVIMSPTRELAQQIDQQMEGFSYFLPASSVAVYGGNDGVRFEQEKKGLTLGADVVIATPGRLISHLSLGYVDLSKVSFFILDEADRMLDMGFIPDVRRIVSAMTSAVNVLPEIEVAVRQMPLTAILSPTFASCKTYGASIVRLSDFDAFRVARSVPTSSMIPVNIFPASPFDIEVRCRLRPAPSGQMQTGTHHLDPVRLCLPPGFSLPHHL